MENGNLFTHLRSTKELLETRFIRVCTFQWNWNLEMLAYLERWKGGVPGEVPLGENRENQQQPQPTDDAMTPCRGHINW